VSILLLTYWKNKSDDEKILGTMREVLEKIEKYARERETGVRFKYTIYAFTLFPNFEQVSKKMGGWGERNSVERNLF
jgi:hypothetical protein